MENEIKDLNNKIIILENRVLKLEQINKRRMVIKIVTLVITIVLMVLLMILYLIILSNLHDKYINMF